MSNRIPRQLATRAFGWFSRIEQPLLARGAIALWRRFSDLDLSEARTQRFSSINACFTRELKEGARPVDRDPRVLTSPCDAIVGAHGRIRGDELLQAKGSPYRLDELLLDPELARHYRDGTYVTLRLTPSMYHRFHAPCDATVERVTYIAGDTWNVNPAALKRVAKLYCRNERVVIRTVLAGSRHAVTLVPVAAILVASIRLRFLDTTLCAQYRGASDIPCHVAFAKGEEMGWFQHGSTIILFAPKGFALCEDIKEGGIIRMGRPLMRLP
ncbi:MAG TPA: archaetidylserine decarboxylase [Stellaceae bacterium]|nr:archaetidylserine decarboxylase [Stellaceae bacterium]